LPLIVTLLARLGFAAALGFTFIEAIIPPQQALHLFPWDKAEHFLAFYVLSICASAAFPRRGLILIAAGLAAFGGLIELVQALPLLHRDCSFQDWLTDVVAITAALAPMALVPWRTAARNS
jgi:hypothetical protein